MPLPRCEHGVYSPDGDGKPSYACSGCFAPDQKMLPPSDAISEHYYHECPECGSKEFEGDDWNGYCPECEYTY